MKYGIYKDKSAAIELRNIISDDEFKKIAAQFGISPVVETFASKVSWFAQIPGFDVFPRTFKLLSKTIVDIVVIISGDSSKETIDRAFTYEIVDMVTKKSNNE